MQQRINIRILSIILSLVTATGFAQPRNEGRYYSRDTELASFSDVLTSTLWAIGLLGFGALILFNLPKNEKDQSGFIIGLGGISTLIGLFCLAPLFAYLFVGLQLVMALAVVVAIVIAIWTSVTKKTEPAKVINTNKNHNTESQKSSSNVEAQGSESKKLVQKVGSVPNVLIADKQEKLLEGKAIEEGAKHEQVSSINEEDQVSITPKNTRRPAPTAQAQNKVIVNDRRHLVGFDQADQIISLKQFMVANDFVKVSPTVRINASGYPFITFITSIKKAENIYFSKDASLNVASGDPVNRELFAGLQVQRTTNADGGVRVTLVQYTVPLSQLGLSTHQSPVDRTK